MMPSTLRPKGAPKQQNQSQNNGMPSTLRPKIKPKEKEVEPEKEEGTLSSAFRTASQIPQGIASTTPPGLIAGLWEMLAHGEVLDPEEIEHIKKISEREGIPFDEEAYMQAAEKALGAVPTVSNIAKKIEEKTGLPLEPKTRLQKGLRFATEATRLLPEGASIRGTNVGLPKPVLGAAVEATKEGLVELGVPESAAELASFAILKQTPETSPKLSVGKKTKSSGLTERGYEKLEKPTKISEKKISQINKTVENEFRDIASDIIEKTPIHETREILKNDKGFKKASSEAFEKVNELAKEIPETFSSMEMKKKIADKLVSKETEGYKLSEFEMSKRKFLKTALKNIPEKELTATNLVKQFRLNNKSFGELIEPGKSSAYNRGKKEALLEENKIIAETIKEKFPESEFSNLFESSNKQWQKIMDAEIIDEFMNDIFTKDINFKEAKKLLEKEGKQIPFKRAMGKEGYKEFTTLLEDLMTTEQANKMMEVAKKKGFGESMKSIMSYLIHPKLGYLKAAKDIGQNLFKKSWESLLDKPQLAVKWDKGIKAFKKGDFKIADKIFSEIQYESKNQKPNQ